MDRAGLAAILGAELRVTEPDARPRVVAAAAPGDFQAAFVEAVASGGPVFLADPAWTAAQRAQAELAYSRPGAEGAVSGRGWLMIPSGGTGGEVKFARHDEETLWTAVRGYSERTGIRRASAVGVLPLHHVSGLMAWLRCALTGGNYVHWEWKRLEAGEYPALAQPADTTISLVPTQLQRLLARPAAVEWLRGLRTVFVGGAPGWPELLNAAAAADLPVSPCYGMTETAAMVAALDPGQFRTGSRDCGPALPHARIVVGTSGRIRINGESVFRGYWPHFDKTREFETADLGWLDAARHLHVTGRADLVIMTGGRKVNPLSIETALRDSGLFEDIVVVGVPDPEWGEAVVAGYPQGGNPPDPAILARALRDIPSYARPKRYVPLAGWSRNSQDKIDRAAIRRLLGAP